MAIKTALTSRLMGAESLSPLLRVASGLFFQFKPDFLHVDEPVGARIDRQVCLVQGWFSWRAGQGSPALRISGEELTWVPVARPDVERILGRRAHRGFRAIVDLNRVLTSEARSGRRLVLELCVDGKTVAAAQLTLAAGLDLDVADATERRKQKHDWLRRNLRCPVCIGELTFFERTTSCLSCGRDFPQNGDIFNLLSEDWKQEFRIEDWTGISANDYDDVASSLLAEVKRSGGKLLDCGSGVRASIDETVICLDVAPFPTVDVLAVNHKLPFADDTFDAIFSLNVLEHVTDPFRCAAELVRVLKPGGKLYCAIPFLQPEHGYPHHYFNATRSGLRQLFPSDVELLRHFVPDSGQPVWTLHWFLNWYLRELPEHEKKHFLDMRFRDVIDHTAEELLDQNWVTQLSGEAKWVLAATTAAVFRKL